MIKYMVKYWDADIIKRVLRAKPGERRLDYEKIKHVCDERIRQIDAGLVEEKRRPCGRAHGNAHRTH